MKKKLLLIKPLDWVAFRAAKSFSTSEDSHFPNIKTFLGALYGNLYNFEGKSAKEISQLMKEKALDITGPFLYKQNENDDIDIFFKKPAILKKEKDNDNECSDQIYDDKCSGQIYKAYIDKNIKFNIGKKELNGLRYKKMDNLDDLNKNFINLKELEDLKTGNLNIKDIEKNSPTNIPYKIERKIGIELEKGKRRTKKGGLYSLNYFRFEDNAGFCFFVEKDDLKLLEKYNTIKLGTKGKLATIEVIEIDTTIFDKVNDVEKILYTLTPSFMESGILPKNSENIQAIANYKSETIGFWNGVENKPGELIKVVPVGSCYYTKGEIDSLTDEYDYYGFGKYIELKR
ncbi:type III-B CRISPR module-associated protein Cmr3 [Oceanotoga teriensis]|uniref:type III-B CRISPR module-associated protein Cmr3 n=1 Tax=Oceanotoga teriensis TaxID=515440 RepID=UPI002712F020|nr:type III-B CRISPR module-associated protein Cmr3 [Oceanotoga teriensis]MDO7976490.1 type III-B CRISPR module-associated protein Cmr3 [Oceanotoga teriensis]